MQKSHQIMLNMVNFCIHWYTCIAPLVIQFDVSQKKTLWNCFDGNLSPLNCLTNTMKLLLSVVSFSLFYSLKKRELQCRKELKLIFLSVNIGCDTKFLKCLYLEFLAMKFPRLLAQIYHFIHLLKKF